MHKCVKYSKKNSQKKLEFFNITQVKYEILTIKIHIKFMFCYLNFFLRDSYNIFNFSGKFY